MEKSKAKNILSTTIWLRGLSRSIVLLIIKAKASSFSSMQKQTLFFYVLCFLLICSTYSLDLGGFILIRKLQIFILFFYLKKPFQFFSPKYLLFYILHIGMVFVIFSGCLK